MSRYLFGVLRVLAVVSALVALPALGQEPQSPESEESSSFSTAAGEETTSVAGAGDCGTLAAGETCSADASDRELLRFLEAFAATVETGCEIEPVSCCGGCAARCPVTETASCRSAVWAWGAGGACRCVTPPTCACE